MRTVSANATMSDLVEDADDALIERAMRDIHHVLYHLFPDRKTTISARKSDTWQIAIS